MDRNRGCPPGIVRSEPLRPPLPPGFYDGPPHAPHHHHYLREVEDCSCTSASEDEEGRIHDERPRNSSQHPKKKCQLNQFVNHHLHRRHYPESYLGASHFSPQAYEHELYSSVPSSSVPGFAAAAAASHPQARLNSSSSPRNHHTVPTYLENIILNSHSMNKPQHDAELMKKLSKCIIIPDNPKDPAAFTVTPGFTGTPKPPWCSSKPVQKIVGTFAILMSLGIIAAVLYVNWSSNTFRPMMK